MTPQLSRLIAWVKIYLIRSLTGNKKNNCFIALCACKKKFDQVIDIIVDDFLSCCLGIWISNYQHIALNIFILLSFVLTARVKASIPGNLKLFSLAFHDFFQNFMYLIITYLCI